MTYNDTETLIQKYLNGETTTEEERLLALEVSREDAPEDWKIIAGMLGELAIDEALFDQMMAERRQKPRISRLWPWVAAACVVAMLIIFLGPPKKENATESQIAKVEPEVEKVVEKATEPKKKYLSQVIAAPQQIHKQKQKAVVKKMTTKAKLVIHDEKVEEPMHRSDDLPVVEKSDNAPFEDPRVQFEEKAKSLRERGTRVIQRVAMNGLPINNHQINDL